MKGWECPKCGKGLAPWVKECDCAQIAKPVEQPIIPNYDPRPGYIRPTPTHPGPWNPSWFVTCKGTSDTTLVMK